MKYVSQIVVLTFVIFTFVSIATATANKQNIPEKRTNPSQSTYKAAVDGGINDKGFCDTPKGCRALKKACLKLKGHKYTPTSSGGVCTEKSTKKTGTKKSIGGIKMKEDELKDATCFGRALCKELRLSCQGTWEQNSSGTYGKCKD